VSLTLSVSLDSFLAFSPCTLLETKIPALSVLIAMGMLLTASYEHGCYFENSATESLVEIGSRVVSKETSTWFPVGDV
jgi:hypothetical protein